MKCQFEDNEDVSPISIYDVEADRPQLNYVLLPEVFYYDDFVEHTDNVNVQIMQGFENEDNNNEDFTESNDNEDVDDADCNNVGVVAKDDDDDNKDKNCHSSDHKAIESNFDTVDDLDVNEDKDKDKDKDKDEADSFTDSDDDNEFDYSCFYYGDF